MRQRASFRSSQNQRHSQNPKTKDPVPTSATRVACRCWEASCAAAACLAASSKPASSASCSRPFLTDIFSPTAFDPSFRGARRSAKPQLVCQLAVPPATTCHTLQGVCRCTLNCRVSRLQRAGCCTASHQHVHGAICIFGSRMLLGGCVVASMARKRRAASSLVNCGWSRLWNGSKQGTRTKRIDP